MHGTLLGDNYYSVLGDEDAEDALDDFDDPTCYDDSQDDFVSLELSKNKVHMDEPNAFRCVQVSGGDGSAPDLPVPCRVNITKEDTYNNGTEFVRVVDEFCKERKFDFRIDSSKRELGQRIFWLKTSQTIASRTKVSSAVVPVLRVRRRRG